MSADYAELVSCSFHVKSENVERVVKELKETKFEPEIDGKGNIFDLSYDGGCYSDEILSIMNKIAPYVEQGSYIEMFDIQPWRWVFQDGICYEITPEILWMPPGSGSRKIIVIVEGGMVTSVLTNDPALNDVEILDRDNMACAEGEELHCLRELEQEIKTGIGIGTLREIF